VKAISNKDCTFCQYVTGEKRINEIPRVLTTKNWVIEHVYPTSVKGWVDILPKRHVTAVHQLTREEMAEFGELLHAVCEGQHELYGAEKEYFMQYSETEGHYHTNVHVVPRLPDWPDSLKGPMVFSALGTQVENPLTPEQISVEVMKLQNYLLKKVPARLLR
jgi:diadenosine tetraphosphate (Ap4A) HIT family hydrolase